MKKCPLCENEIDVDGLQEGDTIDCGECGETLVRKGDELVVAAVDEEEEEEDEEDEEFVDEDEEEEEEED